MKRTARLNLRLTDEERDLFEYAFLSNERDLIKHGAERTPSRNRFAAELLRLALLRPLACTAKTRFTRSRALHDRTPG